MPKYAVPIRYQATEVVVVEADSVEEAVGKAMEADMVLDNVDFDCPEINDDEVEEADDEN
jgi:hypothetical protein